MRATFAYAGFKRVKENNWNIYWGRHLPMDQYQYLDAFQKVNHFPASTQLGRKDYLATNLNKMQCVYGEEVS